MRLDEFNPDILEAEWLFTVALGAGLGLVVAALPLVLIRPRGWRETAAILAIAGVALAGLTGTFALDIAPWQAVDLRLRPYLSTVAETAAMVAALALGAAVAAALALTLAGIASWRRMPLWTAGVGGAVGVALLTLAFLPVVNSAAVGPRHPSGTKTGDTFEARRVLGGLEIPTGLDIAENGDIFVVELPGQRAVLATPAADGSYRLAAEFPIGLAEGDFAFHGVFHPEYPDVPFAYVAAQATDGDVRSIQILRMALDGSGAIVPVVTGLPTAQGRATNHHGAGLAACDGHLYVSTSDGDSIIGRSLPGSQRWAERSRAQLPNSGFGQVMRWQFQGEELVPRGVFGSEYPSFAMGLRNPFGLGCDALTGFPIAADNGEKGFDQVRLIEPGSNHGWPSTSERVDIVPPWFDMGRASIAPTGIAQRPGQPGALIVSGFNSQALYELVVDRDSGEATSVRLLAEVDGGSYAVAIDAAGCVYFTDVGAVYRLQEPGCE